MNPNTKRPDKRENLLTLARVIAQRSHDPHTEVGAVIVGPGGEIRSTGFNGFPRGFQDRLQERLETPEKHNWIIHAELNAIFNATRMGVSLKGCELFATVHPCYECAKAIIQVGITDIMIDHPLHQAFENYLHESNNTRYRLEIAKQILTEGRINVRYYISERNNPNKIWIGGKPW